MAYVGNLDAYLGIILYYLSYWHRWVIYMYI